jgi:hypothetical protein
MGYRIACTAPWAPPLSRTIYAPSGPRINNFGKRDIAVYAEFALTRSKFCSDALERLIKPVKMLDPLTALSVAGTIVQFVDFSASLISKGQAIHRKGSTVQNNELETVTKDLLDITRTLQVSLPQDTSLAHSLSKDEQVRHR